MNGGGGIVLGAIHSDQQWVVEDPKVGQRAMVFEALKDLNKYSIECTRHDGIEQIAHLIVAGNPFNSKQGAGIILSLGLLQPTLAIQKRRRLGKKEAKGA